MALFEYSTGMSAVTETIDFAANDPTDVYQVELTGGFDYEISVQGASSGGGSLQDPYVNIYDSGGSLITSADNSSFSGIPTAILGEFDFEIPFGGGFSQDPSLTFHASSSGIYQIEVSDVAGIGGDYTFNIEQAESLGTPGLPGTPGSSGSLIGLTPEQIGCISIAGNCPV